MSNNKRTEFVRTPNGCKVITQKASVTLTDDEISRLNVFLSSGRHASSPHIEKNIDMATLRRVPLRALEDELDRRDRIREERRESGADD